MPLIKSISGIRGTIGGSIGNTLSPYDIVAFSSAYADFLKEQSTKNFITIAIGKDGRLSGDMVLALVSNTLLAKGIDIIDLGYSTTPTVEYYVSEQKLDGGIIISASHNPENWNALKLLNSKGEFLTEQESQRVLTLSTKNNYSYESVENIGKKKKSSSAIQKHIKAVLDYPLVEVEKIKQRKFKVVVDVINSTGAISVVPLLQELGCEIIPINEDINLPFNHNPEPLESHLSELISIVQTNKADMGIAVDPDVDRLCFIDENGKMFGEEYTLVAVADYVLSKKKGSVVSNMSSTIALKDIADKHGVLYFSSEVGEVNVVRMMKEKNAVIGGEGNGGIIVPDFHFGRDALIGVGLFLTGYIANSCFKLSEYRSCFPNYFMVKTKQNISTSSSISDIIDKISKGYSKFYQDKRDGIKIFLNEKSWLHVRASNTEPIIRVYSEASTLQQAKSYVNDLTTLLHSS